VYLAFSHSEGFEAGLHVVDVFFDFFLLWLFEFIGFHFNHLLV
jgi:hypothetical protein